MVKIKIFIDSSKIQEIKKAKEFGILDGVTTNPSLIKAAVEEMKAGGRDLDIVQYINDILRVAEGVLVSLEVIGTTYDEMVEKLNIAIGQFAKRQMTWLRRWEKQGTKIHWVKNYREAEKIIKNKRG